MELVPNESSAALLSGSEEVVREGLLDNRPRTMSAPLESEEFVTFEVKINGERAGRLKSVSIQDGAGARLGHAPVIYPRSDLTLLQDRVKITKYKKCLKFLDFEKSVLITLHNGQFEVD